MADRESTENPKKRFVGRRKFKYTALGMIMGLSIFVAFGSDFDVAGFSALAVMFIGMIAGARKDRQMHERP